MFFANEHWLPSMAGIGQRSAVTHKASSEVLTSHGLEWTSACSACLSTPRLPAPAPCWEELLSEANPESPFDFSTTIPRKVSLETLFREFGHGTLPLSSWGNSLRVKEQIKVEERLGSTRVVL